MIYKYQLYNKKSTQITCAIHSLGGTTLLFVGLSILNIFCIIALGAILQSAEILRFGIFGGLFLLLFCPLCLLGIYINAKEAEDDLPPI